MLATVGGVTPAQAASCSSGYLCLFNGEGFTGRKLSYRDCAFVDIGQVWGNDKIRSVINNQSKGRLTEFFNWHARQSRFVYVGHSFAKAEHRTVSAGVASAEGVQVCY